MSDNLNSSWRKIASTIYKKPTDSKIFGSVEIDVTDLEIYISNKRKGGLKITLTHFFLLAVARGIRKDIPELNTYVKRGKICSFPSIDTTVSVLLPNGEMGSVKIKNTDQLTLEQSAEALLPEISKTRKGSENQTQKLKESLGTIPWPFRNWIYAFIKKFTVDWGFTIPILDISANTFGTFVLSNIGTLGLDFGYPALLPSSNVAFVFMLGSVNKKAWVINDQIEIRRIITLSAVIDHRIADASHAGKLFKHLKYMIRNPQLLEV